MLLFCMILLYWIVFLEILGQLWLGLDYSVAISYKLDIFVLSRFGGLHPDGTSYALWAQDGKQLLMKDLVVDALNIFIRLLGPLF